MNINASFGNTFAVIDMFKDKLCKQNKTKAQFLAEFEVVKSLDDTMTAEDIFEIEAMIEAKFPSE